jgi:outer membrane murein-binding lipoprotein Lpp
VLKTIKEDLVGLLHEFLRGVRLGILRGLASPSPSPTTAPDYTDLAGCCQNQKVGQFLIRKIAELQKENEQLKSDATDYNATIQELEEQLEAYKCSVTTSHSPARRVTPPLTHVGEQLLELLDPGAPISPFREPALVDPSKCSEK